MFIHFSYAHYPLQTVKRTTTKKPSTCETEHMLIKLGNLKEAFYSFSIEIICEAEI